MASFWAVLGEGQAEIIEQKKVPVLQSLGRKAGLFPLYIQCRAREDAEEIQRIHEPLLGLYTAVQDVKSLAREIHRHLDCANIMRDINLWYVVLNGRSFRGLLYSADDFDSQSRDFKYLSWRSGSSFKEALLIMVLKGEKALLPEVMTLSPSMSATTSDLDHLSVSDLRITVEDDLTFSPPTSACGKKPAQPLGSVHGKPRDGDGPSTSKGRNFGSKSQPMFTNFSQWPRSPVCLPGNGFSVKPVYKYIRNLAGTIGVINDRSGVHSCITSEDYLILGDVRARYLDSHGYMAAEVERIVSAFSSDPTIEGFISRAEGCGMSIVELEWFWSLE